MTRALSLALVLSFLAGCGGKNSEDLGSAQRLDAIEGKLAEIQKGINALSSGLSVDTSTSVEEADVTQAFKRQNVKEAEQFIKELGEKPTAAKLGDALVKLDDWLIASGEEEAFAKIQLDQQVRLRELVREEVTNHHKAALGAPNGTEGMKHLAEAGQVLAMYPMSEDAKVIEEAKALATQQAETAGRLEIIRRQRYNHWAAQRIEEALTYYNENVSKWNPLNDNTVLIDALVTYLGEVDPMLLEPAVLELYNYVVDKTKGSLSDDNKIQLAKKLTDPAIRRISMGDF